MSKQNLSPDEMFLKLKKFFLDREIANFYAYLLTLEKPLNEQTKIATDEAARLQSQIEEFGDSEGQESELTDLLVESLQLEGFTNLLRQSFIVSLYSFLELWLLRECRLRGKQKGDAAEQILRSRRSSMEKARTCFRSVLGSQFPFETSKEWEWIMNFRQVRNCIVHRQGSLTAFSDLEASEQLKAFIAKENGLRLSGTGNSQIFIEHSFCLESLQKIHSLMIILLFPQLLEEPSGQ